MQSDRKFLPVQALRYIPPAVIPALVSAGLAIFLYAVTIRGTYVYDDLAIIRDDPRVHQPSLWKELWTKDYFDGGVDNLYRPIVSSSYALQWFIHGDRPWLFHAVNILLHALACALVAEFTRRVLGAWPRAPAAATCAGLLFAVHPVHVEAVANIVGRAELACTAAIFAALVILCLRPMTYPRMFVAVAFGVIALLCKEQGILQPLIWFLLLNKFVFLGTGISTPIRPRRREEREGRRQEEIPSSSRLLRKYAVGWALPTGGRSPPYSGGSRSRFHPLWARQQPHENLRGRIFQSSESDNDGVLKVLTLLTCWIWAAYIVGRERLLKFEWDRSVMDSTIQPLVKSIGLDRVLMPVILLGHYTALLLWPAHLSPDYGADVIGSVAHLGDPYLWIGFIALAIWLAATVWAWMTARGVILFCLLSLAITYGLIGNILTLIGTIFAERLLYLPSAFFLIIAGILLATVPRKPRVILMTIILTTASYRTFTAARLWNHPLQLYETALQNQPKSLQLRILIAQNYHEAKNEPAAAAILADACKIYPNSWKAWMYRANQAMDAGQLQDAEEYLSRARKLEMNTNLLGSQARLAELRAAQNPKPETRNPNE